MFTTKFLSVYHVNNLGREQRFGYDFWSNIKILEQSEITKPSDGIMYATKQSMMPDVNELGSKKLIYNVKLYYMVKLLK